MATIRFFAAAKAASGCETFQTSAGNVRDAISEIEQQFPNLKTVLTKCSYLLNETACHDPSATLTDQDVVDVLPPFAGG